MLGESLPVTIWVLEESGSRHPIGVQSADDVGDLIIALLVGLDLLGECSFLLA